MEKREVVLDSVKKLLALNVLDEEILLNLEDVGLSKDEAQKVLDEAKGKAPEKSIVLEAQRDSGKVLRDVAENLEKTINFEEDEEEKNERIASEVVGEVIEKGLRVYKKKEIETPQNPAPSISLRVAREEKRSTETPSNLNKLWEKGILITVNQRFNEMQKLKQEIDSVVESKVVEISGKEMQKLKVLFDSQKTLFLDKIDSELEAKGNEIISIIDSRVSEMKKLNDEIKKGILVLEQRKAKFDLTIHEIESKFDELQALKKTISSELSSEMVKYKSSMQGFLDSSEAKMQEIDERVSRTLELESKIAEGLVKDAESKIDKLSLKKADELQKQIEPVLEEVVRISEEIKPERIEEKLETVDAKLLAVDKRVNSKLDELNKSHELVIKVLDKRFSEKNSELAKAKEQMAVELKSGLQAKMGELDVFKESQAEIFGKKLKEKLAEIDSAKQQILQSVDIESAKKLMTDLDSFKNQFIQVIESNVKKNNASMKEFNERMQKLEQLLNSRIQTIDQKVVELDEFEKNFAEEMSTLIEELGKKK